MNQIRLRDVDVEVRGESEHPARALILIHGRGSTAENILSITQGIAASRCIVLAPQANGSTWYPERFIVPKADNEPFLSASLGVIDDIASYVRDSRGIASEQIIFAGFSQGACIVAEYLKQHPAQYRGALVMSGGVIGSAAEAEAPGGKGSLKGTPVYLGCDRRDPHIPLERVMLSEKVLEKLGAQMTTRIYEGLGHSVHPEAIEYLQKALQV